MLTRDELRTLAMGQYAMTHPTPSIENMRLFAEGAVWAIDREKRKEREAIYKKAFMEKEEAKPLVFVAGE